MSMKFETGNVWCLSAKIGPAKQIRVKLSSGETYDYLCRYPVESGDVVIIGNKFISGSDVDIVESKNTGKIGTVESVADQITVKKNYAVEVDFVFTQNVTADAVKQCGKYITIDDYNKILQYGKNVSPVRPITHFVRQYLAAASVLSNESIAGAKTIALARELISGTPVVDYSRISNLYFQMWAPLVELKQTFTPNVNVEDELKAISGNAFIKCGSSAVFEKYPYKELLDKNEVKAFIVKYSYLGAVSVMIQCGLGAMLEAFLNAYPENNKYAAEAIAVCQSNEEAANTIKNILSLS